MVSRGRDDAPDLSTIITVTIDLEKLKTSSQTSSSFCSRQSQNHKHTLSAPNAIMASAASQATCG